ncbi:MAG: LPS-assembly protein LptD [Propylenella sp.]
MRFIVAYARREFFSRLPGVGRLLMAFALSLYLVADIPAGLAQSLIPPAGPAGAPGQRLLLEADQLVYDFDRQVVTAIGNVQIYYGGFVLDAGEVAYDQKSGRLIASGGVRLLEPDGHVATADRLDITDDFRDGFVASLNVITPDRARFSAQTAERRDGNLIIFHDGAYTACEPCLEHPERPPLWQIRAARIVHNRTERMVYYEGARLEFLGIPVAYTPIFFHPDPTVRRKTGFLIPSILSSDSIGTGVTTPFFWNLAPNYDVTLSPTFLTRQGLLGQAQWRHRLINGSYSIRMAGIFQRDPGAFRDNGVPLSGDREFRGSARTRGDFSLGEHWGFGWDVHAMTDRTVNRDYKIPGAATIDLPSTAYLTGANDTNLFEARGYYFHVQREDTIEDLPDDGDPTTVDRYVHDDQNEQAFVHPVLDHNYIFDQPVLGGELRLDSNLASVTRRSSDLRHPAAPFGAYYAGVAGTFTRATSRASWQRRFIAPGGQLVTPFVYLQADSNWIRADDAAAGLSSSTVLARAMPAVGVEYEWPFLATIGSSVHTFGPKVQLIARPDEAHPGALPNEDSQSLVFDDTTLFLWDKFSGYDRQEGGVRANAGLVYQGLFSNGATVDALFGQSFQLYGENSFALQDHALTGVGSGLETKDSDIVGRVTVNTGLGIAATGRARFDKDDWEVNSAEISAIGTYRRSSASLGYAYYRTSQAAGIFTQREEVNAAASIQIADNWSLIGSLVYDLANRSDVSRSLGLAYADDCFELSAVYSETTDPYSDLISDRQIFFRFSLRTLASSSFSSQLGAGAE